jgi:hypothetical protein
MSEAAKQYLAKKKLQRMEENSAWFGYAILLFLVVIAVVLFCFGPSAQAGEMDAWEFHVFGVNIDDVKDRDWTKVVIGGVGGIIAHEVLGHMLFSELLDMGHPSFDFDEFVVYSGDGYQDASKDRKALYSASGLLVQATGSLLLTIIPATRHSDYTVGWNVATAATGTLYGITGGTNKDVSDVELMEQNGWPGTEIAYGTGAIGLVTTYYSLDKAK